MKALAIMKRVTLPLFTGIVLFLSQLPLAQAAPVAGDLVPVKVHRLGVDPNSGQPVVFLTDASEERTLPIWIGPCEATALNTEMEGGKTPRPLTHDLTGAIVRKLNAKIQRVIISAAKDGIYYATLVLEKDGSALEIDARPSDSIVLAVKAKAPIFVAKSVFGDHGVALKTERAAEEAYGITVQEMNPSLAQSFSFPQKRGVLISDVRPGSQAEKDGLERGDILVEAGSQSLSDVNSLRAALSRARAPLSAKVFHKGTFTSMVLNPKK